jgi:flavin reductase (DIM6/NTAB) family NADH-FMN oxidoreductase RutF
MERNNIDIADLNVNVFEVLNSGWMLLTAGDYRHHNCMTVSWGFLGTFWAMPVAVAGVRPQRHTFKFIEQAESFTLCAFSDRYRDALTLCGTKSGRDCDKVTETGLTPIRLEEVEVPGYAEAELIIECRIVYADELKGKNFMDKSIVSEIYPERDYHKLFYGKVVNISGTDKYIK